MAVNQPDQLRPEQEAAASEGTCSNEIEGEYWRWCPRCGHELHSEKCKLTCPRCRYFMSCSDFD
jgi:Zn finger protein HypA/HybF involved in hydrogenase expression